MGWLNWLVFVKYLLLSKCPVKIFSPRLTQQRGTYRYNIRNACIQCAEWFYHEESLFVSLSGPKAWLRAVAGASDEGYSALNIWSFGSLALGTAQKDAELQSWSGSQKWARTALLGWRSTLFPTVLSKLPCASESPGWVLHGSCRVSGYGVQTSSQVMFMLLAQGPELKQQSSRAEVLSPGYTLQSPEEPSKIPHLQNTFSSNT